ncbi:MAG: endo,3,4-beta-glycanase ExsH [Pseudomonadota bacterium]|jgi:beta-glucanase (GH16 family)
MKRFLGVALSLVLLLSPATATDIASQGTIDTSKMKLTFSEEFDAPLDVSPWGPGTRWIAHTPWNGDFGDSKFSNPAPGFPFVVKNGKLRIEARKTASGVWRSGLLSSVGRDWKGFAQKYGYFEMKAKLPPGPGLWPAFWLIGIDRKEKKHTAEIDIIEHYGHMPDRYSTGTPVWNRNGVRGNNFKAHTRIPVAKGSLYADYNTYGALIDHDWIRIYFNRKEVWRTPTQPEHRQPMFVLMNLAMGPGWPIDKTPNPSFMYIDYVKVWQTE